MKHKKKLVVVWGMCMVLVMSLCACGKNDDNKQTETKAQYTITFMQGNKKLGEIKAEEGAVLNKEDYAEFEKIEGAEFVGWYETPGFLDSSLKDLSKDTFKKNTTLYGSFASKNVSEDTRVWYLAGTSEKSILKLSSWAGTAQAEDMEKLELKATGNAKNEFSITVDLYKGDEFQVIHDWAWADQKGFGCVTTVDETQFEGGGGLGGSAETSNINVIMDGNYTITLTTNPENSSLDTFVIVRNGDVQN